MEEAHNKEIRRKSEHAPTSGVGSTIYMEDGGKLPLESAVFTGTTNFTQEILHFCRGVVEVIEKKKAELYCTDEEEKAMRKDALTSSSVNKYQPNAAVDRRDKA